MNPTAKPNSKFLAFLICSLMMPGQLVSQAPRNLTIAQILQEGLPTKDMFSKGGKVFTLSNIGITDLAGIERIPDIGNARVIGLDHNNVEVLKANTFNHPQFKDLSALDLSYNNMSAIEPGAFKGLPNLNYVWLNDNQLKELPDGIFSGLDKLKFVFIGNNPGGQALVQQVKKQLPQAEVYTTSMKIMRLKKAARVAGIALAVIAAVLAFLVIQHNRDIASNEATAESVYAAAQKGALSLLTLKAKGGARPDKMGNALVIAASQGDLKTAGTLIQGGAPINGLEHPRHYESPDSANYENAIFVDSLSPLIHAAAAGQKEMVEFLLDNKANIEAVGRATTEQGRALDHAIAHGHVEVVRLLVDRKADINHGSDNFEPRAHFYGAPPLQLAETANIDQKAKDEIIKILVDHGAPENPPALKPPDDI